ncbi:50S ribosomal protein L10 [Candidatus Uhrbacteria bacterium CG10_big_fil_rev_8_21_14_0_10_50_16]|uniref:Large ribosomal subunit protein uL10 n=1 Tax=Candidatus Uhrbacteria bacterium CG10_big_fil_rev_8_21_14_0_10_50_16 TaxID=1975039 RepID=A0A2H0RND5_9BACT|nr:MAG: 50S ribosomal protein L10 [Candidatus Uhrbacteria bacterium CG10_big_fil_rev_8_21_14_0_10_50_16]
MAKTRAQKEQMIADLTDTFSKTKSVVFAEFSGVPVQAMDRLRTQARNENIAVSVSKKTLMNIAAQQAGWTGVDTAQLPNSVVTLMGYEDEVLPAKLVAAFAKGQAGVQIVGGVLEGAYASADQMIALSQLPGKQELYAKLVGSINAPVSGFVNVLAGNIRGLLYTLNAIQEQKA